MTLITLVLPVFATVLAGWLARRSGLIDLVIFRGLTDVVFYLAMPALLFNAVVHGPELELLGVATVYFSACLIIFAIGAVSGRVQGLPLAHARRSEHLLEIAAATVVLSTALSLVSLSLVLYLIV